MLRVEINEVGTPKLFVASTVFTAVAKQFFGYSRKPLHQTFSFDFMSLSVDASLTPLIV